MSDQRLYQSEVKSIDESQRIIRVRLTDATRDRMRETIPLGSWKQPLPESIPINFGHDNSRPAIARGRNLQLRRDGLYCDVVFPPRGVSAESDMVFDLLKLGILTDVSVEFLGRREGDTYVEAELLGAGVVNIGANPRAQVVARALGFDVAGFDDGVVVLHLLDDEADHDAVVLHLLDDEPELYILDGGRRMTEAEIRRVVAATVRTAVGPAARVVARLRGRR